MPTSIEIPLAEGIVSGSLPEFPTIELLGAGTIIENGVPTTSSIINKQGLSLMGEARIRTITIPITNTGNIAGSFMLSFTSNVGILGRDSNIPILPGETKEWSENTQHVIPDEDVRIHVDLYVSVGSISPQTFLVDSKDYVIFRQEIVRQAEILELVIKKEDGTIVGSSNPVLPYSTLYPFCKIKNTGNVDIRVILRHISNQIGTADDPKGDNVGGSPNQFPFWTISPGETIDISDRISPFQMPNQSITIQYELIALT